MLVVEFTGCWLLRGYWLTKILLCTTALLNKWKWWCKHCKDVYKCLNPLGLQMSCLACGWMKCSTAECKFGKHSLICHAVNYIYYINVWGFVSRNSDIFGNILQLCLLLLLCSRIFKVPSAVIQVLSAIFKNRKCLKLDIYLSERWSKLKMTLI